MHIKLVNDFKRLFCNFLCIFFILLIASCYHSSKLSLFSGNKMTINYRILVGQSLNATQKSQIHHLIDETFEEINQIYNKWNPQSEISHLNQLKAGKRCLLSTQLYQFFQRLDQLVHLTEGRFDPTIEPLQKLWKSHLELGLIPDPLEIEALKPCLGWDKIHFKDQVFYKEDSRTQIDLGGIAKGYCVDLLVERLQQKGYANVFVDWGGEIRTSGMHPDHRLWNIYISHFKDSHPTHALAYLSLDNQAIATSGDYYQQWTVNTPEGQTLTYSHIFNPKTLQPIIVSSKSIASASLIANDCTTADGIAKVLMLFDSAEDAQQWIESLRPHIPRLAYWVFTNEAPLN